jgi:hypothetical protein
MIFPEAQETLRPLQFHRPFGLYPQEEMSSKRKKITQHSPPLVRNGAKRFLKRIFHSYFPTKSPCWISEL